jgi:cytochrome P450
LLVSTLAARVPIEDPQFYLNDPWPTFAELRRNDPFYYYEPLDCFVITRSADIRAILASPSFVSSRGIFLNDWKYAAQAGDSTVTDSFFPKGGEQVGTTDPPRQTELRRVIAPAFSSRAMKKMTDGLAIDIDAMLDEIEPGSIVDWIHYASLVPIKAATKLIGLPDTDADRVQFWSDELEKLGGDITFEELEAAAHEFQSLQKYIIDNIEIRQQNQKPDDEDLLAVMLNAELDNDRVSEANVVMFAMTAMAAGSDTTRALLAGMVYHLAQNPEQWELLRGDRSLVPLAIEETLRYVTPARAFGRTATEDVEINGQAFRAGQRAYCLYMAANRDESVFPDADTFDVTRTQAVQHLAFGAGAHVCAGSRLVRLEAPMLLNALLDRYSRVELAGDATAVVHVIRNSWSTMPVTFHV